MITLPITKFLRNKISDLWLMEHSTWGTVNGVQYVMVSSL